MEDLSADSALGALKGPKCNLFIPHPPATYSTVWERKEKYLSWDTYNTQTRAVLSVPLSLCDISAAKLSLKDPFS